VFSVSRYGSATVRFTVRRTSLLTQVLQHRHSSLATTTAVDATTTVVVVAVADAERTSNILAYNIFTKGWHKMPALFVYL
jgi:hypothetical protein